MTVNYRCIGKGTTDSNGVAHITHDCSGNALTDDGYKGVGAGLMDFIASTDAPADISESSFQSETYTLLDAIYHFTNTYTAYKNNSVTVTSNTDSVTFGASGGNGLVYLVESGYWTGNYCFEFKLISYSTNSIGIRCPNNINTSLRRPLADLNATNGDVIRCENDGTVVNFYVNGTLKTTRSNNGTIRYGFSIDNGESITVTDMKFYPI